MGSNREDLHGPGKVEDLGVVKTAYDDRLIERSLAWCFFFIWDEKQEESFVLRNSDQYGVEHLEGGTGYTMMPTLMGGIVQCRLVRWGFNDGDDGTKSRRDRENWGSLKKKEPINS